jgi:hypothetical protein
MDDPVAAARHAAKVLAPGGTVMLVEPFANDKVENNRSSVARHGFTTRHRRCCAAHTPSRTVASWCSARRRARHEARLAEVFHKAGFTHFRRAAETPFNLLLEARR